MFKHFGGSQVAVAVLLTACGGSGSPTPQPTERVALFAGTPGRDASVSGGLVDGPAAGARFSLGLHLAVGPEGNLYVADIGNHAIRKITPQGVVSTLLVRNVPGEDLLGVAVDPAGVVHFSVTSCTFSSDHTIVLGCHGTVYRLSAALQAEPVIPLTSGDGSSLDLVEPMSLAFDRAGNLYFSESLTSCAVRRLTPSGDLTTVASLCGSVAVAPDGGLYVAGAAVWRITNGAVSLVAGDPRGSPSNVDGTGPNARFAGTGGMAFDGRGNLYVADTGSMTVRKITPIAMVTTVAGTPTPELPGLGRFVPGALPGELDHPGDVAIVGSDLYVTMPFSIAVVHDVP